MLFLKRLLRQQLSVEKSGDLRRAPSERNDKLAFHVQQMLEARAESVPFHGWPHTEFVRAKAVEFACERDAHVEIVEAAALVHDLNYLVRRNSPPSAGRDMRWDVLGLCGFRTEEMERIEGVIEGAHTAHRRRKVDRETACLSDADTLYKTLPITPVLYAPRYLQENGLTLSDLARKIVDEQVHKHDGNFYFYDRALRRRYRRWAEANLGLWKEIDRAMADPVIASLAAKETTAQPAG